MSRVHFGRFGRIQEAISEATWNNTPRTQATQTREEEEHLRGGSSGEGLEGDRVWEERTTVLLAPGRGNVTGAQLSVL